MAGDLIQKLIQASKFVQSRKLSGSYTIGYDSGSERNYQDEWNSKEEETKRIYAIMGTEYEPVDYNDVPRRNPLHPKYRPRHSASFTGSFFIPYSINNWDGIASISSGSGEPVYTYGNDPEIGEAEDDDIFYTKDFLDNYGNAAIAYKQWEDDSETEERG